VNPVATASVSTIATIYSSRAWRLSLLMLAILAGVFLLYRPSSESLWSIWNDTGRITYTHGFMIAALSAWLVLRRRRDLAALAWRPSMAGTALAVLAGALWFIAVRAGIEIIHQVLLVVLMWLTVWSVFGMRMALVLWLPVAFLLFAVPVWDAVNSLLQGATVLAVQALLKSAGIAAYVNGSTVHVAAGIFEVEGGCSGIHFFIVSIALAVLYGELGRDTFKVRVVLVALAVGFALVTNWLRVFIIVVAGHLTDMQHYLVREDHYYFGWGLFAVMMLIYLLIARHLVPAQRDESETAPAPAPAAGQRTTGVLLALACVSVVPVWEILNPVTAAPLPAPGAMLPEAPAGWSRTVPTLAWNPAFAGADSREQDEYVDAHGRHVTAFVAIYGLQRQGKELVAYGNSLLGQNEGAIVSGSRVDSAGAVRELIVEHSDRRSLIHFHYRVGDRRTARGIAAQLWYGLGTFRGPTASSVVALRTDCVPDCDAARRLLGEFARQE
jgi:exosortase A